MVDGWSEWVGACAGNPSPVDSCADGAHTTHTESNARGRPSLANTKVPYKLACYQRSDFQVCTAFGARALRGDSSLG